MGRRSSGLRPRCASPGHATRRRTAPHRRRPPARPPRGRRARGEDVGRADGGGVERHAATRLRPVEGPEDLVAPGVDDGRDQPRLVTVGLGQQIEAGDPDRGPVQGVRQGFCRGHADPQPGEQARSDVDGDDVDVGQGRTRGLGQEVQSRGEGLGVPAAGIDGEQPEHAVRSADGGRDLGGGRVDGEDDQRRAASVASAGSCSSAMRSARAVQRGPTVRTTRTRSPSSMPYSMVMER